MRRRPPTADARRVSHFPTTTRISNTPRFLTPSTPRPLRCSDHPTLWDQDLFKDVFKIGGLRIGARHGVPEALVKKRLFLGYNGTMAVGILPVATFCSGHTYFVQKMPQGHFRARIDLRCFEASSITHLISSSGTAGLVIEWPLSGIYVM